MGARQKLNSANITGAFIISGLIGLATQSILIFVIALVVIIALAINSGDIRVNKR